VNQERMGRKGAKREEASNLFAPFRPMPSRISRLTHASPAWLKGNGNNCYAGYCSGRFYNRPTTLENMQENIIRY